ncbi:MAG TPA: bifunctional homocysteine S-methyltransferase/methylenetetrahydrofolate reductase [Vicinamibacterales bacterium]|nr:bifunctional homocysteine S-methyltransferase/methylenetetrahydrofolate reductase [Vicinamibacterales bacterium]
MQNFLEALDERVLVCDGAMGTMLYAAGVFINRSFDELNVVSPELVADVHRQYLRAGADVIETNTFGANPFKLATFGLAGETAAINRAGAAIARRAALGTAWVAGSIGPLGVRLAPWGRTSVEEAEAAFRTQAEALVEGGVDLVILETFRDLNELVVAIRAVRAVSSLPLVAQLTTGEDGHTLDGTPPDVFTPALEQAGADVVGLNCSVGPAAMLETIEAMAHVSNVRLAAQPNAGRPRDIEGRNLYLSSPEYMASYARRFVRAGVRLVGGCCGTTPAHTEQIAAAVKAMPAVPRRTRPSTAADRHDPQPPAAWRDKSALARALADGQFVVIAEVAAPRGLDLSAPIADARCFRNLGAVAVNVPDYPVSGARVSAQTLAVRIEQSGVETLLHCTCRERTLLGLQSDLVAADVLGLRNLLLTTGSPRPSAAHGETSSAASFEVDAVGLLHMASELNRGLDVAGQPIGEPTRLHVAAAFNPFAADMDTEWRRLEQKIYAGAEFVLTPPVLDVDAFEPVLARLRTAGVPIVAGVAALEGVRHAEFLASEVTGVRVSDATLARLNAARDEAEEAMRMTIEIVTWLYARVQGLHVTSFHGSPRTAERLLTLIGPTVVGAPVVEQVRHA